MIYVESYKVNRATLSVSDLPRFGKPLNNLTVSVGREAIFACVVENLGPYKVSIKIFINFFPFFFQIFQRVLIL